MNVHATTFTARHAMGHRVVGQALVAHDGFSARYDLNRLQGVFSRPSHQLVGQSYVDKILVLDTAKGGVATAWMLHEMRSRNMAPAAIVFNTVNTILAQGAALGDVAMLAGFVVLLLTLHVARWIGRLHGRLAKAMLVKA